jgi:hypothetical protein
MKGRRAVRYAIFVCSRAKERGTGRPSIDP